MKWYIGCSGFYYKEWKDFFYPRGLSQSDWFSFYCKHFNTIEINATFYKMPTQKSLAKWYNESPPGFLFTIKAPRLITHYKQLNDCEQLLSDFYRASTDGLQEKLAVVLFQFPPKFDFTVERLNLLINLLDPSITHVVEFRHPSWWQNDIYEKLSKHHIIFSGQSYPSTLSDEVIVNNAMIYYRFHGKPILYKSEYPLITLTKFKDEIPKNAEKVFVYFNNTWGTGALTNATQLQELIKNQ